MLCNIFLAKREKECETQGRGGSPRSLVLSDIWIFVLVGG